MHSYRLQPLWRLMNARPVLIATLALAAWLPIVWFATMAGGWLDQADTLRPASGEAMEYGSAAE